MRTLITAAADKLNCDPNVIAEVAPARDNAHPGTDHRVVLVTGTTVYVALGAPVEVDAAGELIDQVAAEYGTMTKAQLVEAAKVAGIAGYSSMSKPELVVALESAPPPAVEPEPAADVDPQADGEAPAAEGEASPE